MRFIAVTDKETNSAMALNLRHVVSFRDYADGVLVCMTKGSSVTVAESLPEILATIGNLLNEKRADEAALAKARGEN